MTPRRRTRPTRSTSETTDDTQAEVTDGSSEHGEAEPSSEASEASPEDVADLPDGAVAAPDDGSIPEGYEIKGNANSMKYHVPGGRYYDITIGDVFFDTVEHAEAAGYEAPVTDDAVIEETIEAEHADDTEENS